MKTLRTLEVTPVGTPEVEVSASQPRPYLVHTSCKLYLNLFTTTLLTTFVNSSCWNWTLFIWLRGLVSPPSDLLTQRRNSLPFLQITDHSTVSGLPSDSVGLTESVV